MKAEVYSPLKALKDEQKFYEHDVLRHPFNVYYIKTTAQTQKNSPGDKTTIYRDTDSIHRDLNPEDKE